MKILMIAPIEKTGGVSTHAKALVRELKKLGCSVEVYNTSPNRDYPKLVSNVIKAYKKTLGVTFKLLRDRNKFDIIHVQASGPMAGFIPVGIVSLLKHLYSFKFIVTFHYRPDINFIKKYNHIFEIVLQQSDAFFVVSTKQLENLNAVFRGKFRKKIFLTYNGFNKTKFKMMPKNKVRALLNLDQNIGIVLAVGNLLPVKGHKYLVEAMEKVVRVRNDVLCVIVGDGMLRKDLERQIKKLNLENHIKLVGVKPHDEIPLWMNAADLFVLPSLRESFGVVQIEAMACGKPVVATRNGGSEEIITSEDYGLLCEPGNRDDLAEKILIALDKEWDREKIRKYAEQFTWEKIAKQVYKIYNKGL